jgi:hypothetical protein
MQSWRGCEFNLLKARRNPRGRRRVCLLPIAGNGGDAMGFRFPPFRLARQFTTDVRTLFCRHVRGGPSISDRLLALDRIAGSLVLLCVTLSAAWLAGQMMLPNPPKMPRMAESAQASSDALDLGVQKRAVEAAAEPLTVDDVRKLQNWLVVLGFDPGPVDGRPGPRTLNAFNQYRASKNLGPVSRIDRANAADLLN